MPIPVVDIFAGPGGLSEGFASVRSDRGHDAFDVILSVEKEKHAHNTLTLRKLVREVGTPALRVLAKGASLGEVFEVFPRAYAHASSRALQLELGRQTAEAVEATRVRLRRSEPWVLIGGPPCQAYSLVGRARRRGIATYVPAQDERHTLYLEYLQMLAECEPTVFVMENVKGLLSAIYEEKRMFDRIADDLTDPAKALHREGRSTRGKPRYQLFAFDDTGLRVSSDSRDYVVRAEEYGVPQARHRIIIVGLLDGCGVPPLVMQPPNRVRATVRGALDGLPSIRSGISRQADGPVEWRNLVRSLSKQSWRKVVAAEVREEIDRAASRVVAPRMNRGDEILCVGHGKYVFNHSARAHIPSDLARYFFAASFARVAGRSPGLQDFPTDLLPEHRNVRRSLRVGTFTDRFRVQVGDAPSSTITSHIAKDGHYYIHFDPAQCRSLTVREAARLQTFPDDYVFTGPRTAQYLQVGNAVPPLLAKQIAEVVHSLIA